METPCVAIGGITPENAEPLVDAGADFLAVSAGVWSHKEGPAAAVRQFNAIFDRALSGEVGTGSPLESAKIAESLEHHPIQLDRMML